MPFIPLSNNHPNQNNIWRKVFYQLNIIGQCRQYNIPLLQCPNFLFPLMGAIIIAVMIISYLVASQFIADPRIIISIIAGTTIFLLIISFIIIKSFEHLVIINKMKNEFISIASHQLRSPLTSVKWILELFQKDELGKLTPEQAEYLRILNENNERMIHLVNNLLNISRIETKNIKIEKKPIKIKSLIDEIVKNAQIEALPKNIKIEVKTSSHIPSTIKTDKNKLEIILQNLIDNAIKYSHQNGQISIRFTYPRSTIKIEIKDNGVGIPEKEQNYIFQKFFRAANATRRQITGTGLGLYLAKSITEALGGKISFKSKEGVGSTFWIELPSK